MNPDATTAILGLAIVGLGAYVLLRRPTTTAAAAAAADDDDDDANFWSFGSSLVTAAGSILGLVVGRDGSNNPTVDAQGAMR